MSGMMLQTSLNSSRQISTLSLHAKNKFVPFNKSRSSSVNHAGVSNFSGNASKYAFQNPPFRLSSAIKAHTRACTGNKCNSGNAWSATEGVMSREWGIRNSAVPALMGTVDWQCP